MANESVNFTKGLSTNLPTNHVAGRLIVTTDTGEMYLDTTSSTRISIVTALTNEEIDEICV